MEATKPRDSDAFFLSVTQTFNSCRSLDCGRSNRSIIFFNDLRKPIEIYIYARNYHPFTSYLTAKHPKHNKFAITDMRKKPVELFLLCDTGVNFCSRNNFADLGSFAKVFVLVESIIPCSLAA